MEWEVLNLGGAFVLGHLIADEHNILRKYLLYLFARYVEIPLLRFGYRGTLGDLRRFSEHKLSRLLLKKMILYPLGKHVDTGHPMLTADVLALIERQETAIAVGPCRCRIAHESCSHRRETDIVIRTGTPAFTKAWPKDYRHITPEEAKGIVNTCAAEGLWHMVFVHCPTDTGLLEYAVCNCCADGCVPFLLNKVFGQDGFPLIRGEHVAQTTINCRGCGECLAVCPWEARTLVDGQTAVDTDRCYGCGLCARVCKNEGIHLLRERRRPPLATPLPADRAPTK